MVLVAGALFVRLFLLLPSVPAWLVLGFGSDYLSRCFDRQDQAGLCWSPFPISPVPPDDVRALCGRVAMDWAMDPQLSTGVFAGTLWLVFARFLALFFGSLLVPELQRASALRLFVVSGWSLVASLRACPPCRICQLLVPAAPGVVCSGTGSCFGIVSSFCGGNVYFCGDGALCVTCYATSHCLGSWNLLWSLSMRVFWLVCVFRGAAVFPCMLFSHVVSFSSHLHRCHIFPSSREVLQC